MEIELKEAMLVIQNYPEIPIVFLNGITVNSHFGREKKIPPKSKFSREVSIILREAHIVKFNVYFTEDLYKALSEINPDKFRRAYKKGTVVEIDKILSDLDEVNSKSKRKRYLISCSEIYNKTAVGNFIPVLKFGEKITYKIWQDIKTKIEVRKNISFRYNETGIIVFVDLRPGGDDYLKRFYKNTDLVTSLVGRKQTDKINISNDFIGSFDVISVDDPNKLLEEYSNGSWKLIIVGDNLSKDYADALSMVKKYDRYVRFMVATNIDLSKKDLFISKVREAYNKDIWDEKI